MPDIDTGPSCEVIVKAHDKAVCCDLCNKWILIKSNDLLMIETKKILN